MSARSSKHICLDQHAKRLTRSESKRTSAGWWLVGGSADSTGKTASHRSVQTTAELVQWVFTCRAPVPGQVECGFYFRTSGPPQTVGRVCSYSGRWPQQWLSGACALQQISGYSDGDLENITAKDVVKCIVRNKMWVVWVSKTSKTFSTYCLYSTGDRKQATSLLFLWIFELHRKCGWQCRKAGRSGHLYVCTVTLS